MKDFVTAFIILMSVILLQSYKRDSSGAITTFKADSIRSFQYSYEAKLKLLESYRNSELKECLQDLKKNDNILENTLKKIKNEKENKY